MLEYERNNHKHNAIAKMFVNLRMVGHLYNFDYHWYEIVEIFLDKSQLSKQSEILDKFLEEYFNTSYIVSLVPDDGINLNNQKPLTLADKSRLFNSQMMIYIADIFPSKKEFYLYKIQHPNQYNERYLNFFSYHNYEKY